MNIRYQLAEGALIALLTIPVIATMRLDAIATNTLVAALALPFVFLMLPELIAEVRKAARDPVWRLAAIIFAACMTSWLYFQGPFLTISRFWFYLAMLLMLPALAAWFRETGETGLRRLFYAKLAVTLLALALIGGAMALQGGDRGMVLPMPVYRHIRHMNYDLTLVIALTLYFSNRLEARWARWTLIACLVIFGYFSAWSGGRGEVLALLVILGGLMGSRRLGLGDRHWWVVLAALAVGALVVVAAGHDRLLTEQINRSAATTINAVSSGRLGMWMASLDRLPESPASLLFGFAPEAFIRLNLVDTIWPGSRQYFTHPHNAFVQWLLEFGVLGTLLLLVLWGRLAVACLRALLTGSGFDLRSLVAATLLGLFVFAMTDGLFYHAIPLTMILVLSAYFVTSGERVERKAVTAFSTVPDRGTT